MTSTITTPASPALEEGSSSNTTITAIWILFSCFMFFLLVSFCIFIHSQRKSSLNCCGLHLILSGDDDKLPIRMREDGFLPDRMAEENERIIASVEDRDHTNGSSWFSLRTPFFSSMTTHVDDDIPIYHTYEHVAEQSITLLPNIPIVSSNFEVPFQDLLSHDQMESQDNNLPEEDPEEKLIHNLLDICRAKSRQSALYSTFGTRNRSVSRVIHVPHSSDLMNGNMNVTIPTEMATLQRQCGAYSPSCSSSFLNVSPVVTLDRVSTYNVNEEDRCQRPTSAFIETRLLQQLEKM